LHDIFARNQSKRVINRYLLISLIAIVSCQSKRTFQDIDLQGHRGARGLWPENTIPGFLNAIDLGVNTLEMDLAVTAEGQLVVSHEPYLSSEICLDQNGKDILEAQQLSFNIFKMTYDQLVEYDCGSRIHPRFPDQEKMAVFKPRLVDVINHVETYLKEKSLPTVNYNIEIKSSIASDNLYHPTPAIFSDLVYQLVNLKLDWSRVTIQSFDFRVLQYFHTTYPDVTLALLIESELPWKANIDSLGFTPQIYSCDYNLLTKETVSELQTANMKVIPWTVNERADMDRLLEWGVDGIITDYPDRTK
jgi:glycerophosphoryl diester phosphodiesterase